MILQNRSITRYGTMAMLATTFGQSLLNEQK